jgi:hypothetical protein
MDRLNIQFKLATLVLFFSFAALSPAPINTPIAKGHTLPVHTPEQKAEELKLNGKIGVVGGVPIRTNEDGTGPAPAPNNQTAASNLANATPVQSDPRAVRNLTKASDAIKQANAGPFSSWLTGLVVVALGFGAFQGLRFWLDKYGPGPKKF